MVLVIGGLLLIGIGLAAAFNKKNGPKTTVQVIKKTEETKKKEEKKENKVAKEVVRSVPIEQLSVPLSFPNEVVFYYGTQTGTAEKFCGVLEQEAQTIFTAQ